MTLYRDAPERHEGLCVMLHGEWTCECGTNQVTTRRVVPVEPTELYYIETERQEVLDAGVIMIHQHGKGKQECLMIEGCTNPRVMLTALRVLRHALGEPA